VPSGVGIEVAFLLGQGFVEGLVDERQRLAHAERLALGVEHLGIAGIDRHAGADGRLGQVHRRDVAALAGGPAPAAVRLSAQQRTRGGWRSGRWWRWRQTRTMLEASALVPEPIMRLLSSVRIGQVPLMAKPASITAARKVSQPVLVVPSSSSLSACLKA
jgi:hypothetical protein